MTPFFDAIVKGMVICNAAPGKKIRQVRAAMRHMDGDSGVRGERSQIVSQISEQIIFCNSTGTRVKGSPICRCQRMRGELLRGWSGSWRGPGAGGKFTQSSNDVGGARSRTFLRNKLLGDEKFALVVALVKVQGLITLGIFRDALAKSSDNSNGVKDVPILSAI